MPFSQQSGYTPRSIEGLMNVVMEGVNAQFNLTYTPDSFIGTNFYKYYYSLIQRLQENEVKTSEIFLKLQDYFKLTNERISRPVVTSPGLISRLLLSGYKASIKAPIVAEAGQLFVCVDTDELAPDYAAVKLAINTIIKDSSVAGVVSQGTELNAIVLSNGQSFNFRFGLPSRIPILLRLTVTLSQNNQVSIATPDEQKFRLIANIAARYGLGKNFEPDRYYSTVDAPWASAILLERSIDSGVTWVSTIFSAEFNEIYTFGLADITLVEN